MPNGSSDGCANDSHLC